MKIIPLTRTPNQAISFLINETLYGVRIETRGGSVCFDISVDGEVVVLGARALINTPIIQPVSMLDRKAFIILGNTDDLVDYNQFGITQFLAFVTPADFNFSTLIPQTPIIIPVV